MFKTIKKLTPWKARCVLLRCQLVFPFITVVFGLSWTNLFFRKKGLQALAYKWCHQSYALVSKAYTTCHWQPQLWEHHTRTVNRGPNLLIILLTMHILDYTIIWTSKKMHILVLKIKALTPQQLNKLEDFGKIEV